MGNMRIERTGEFAAWLDSLKDLQGRARIQARIARLAHGNAGQCRHLTGGVSELKIDAGPGYRVYYTQRGKVLIILLCGGAKSTQQADIRRAQAMVKQL
jgi:putative addiction module killer protein